MTPLRTLRRIVQTQLGRAMTPLKLMLNARKPHRMLEIGPGGERLPGFETLDIIGGRNVDYVADATRPLPFADDTFEVLYASHILEHVPWYQTERVLKEWVRVLRPGGRLEVWVPDGLKICQALVGFEERGQRTFEEDGWFRFNDDHDPCLWASGRIFTYGDGTGRIDHPNWHRALFTPRRLRLALELAGLEDVTQMDRSEVRGYDHAWINLGTRGIKPCSIAA